LVSAGIINYYTINANACPTVFTLTIKEGGIHADGFVLSYIMHSTTGWVTMFTIDNDDDLSRKYS
jgi:hypothetical protein